MNGGGGAQFKTIIDISTKSLLIVLLLLKKSEFVHTHSTIVRDGRSRLGKIGEVGCNCTHRELHYRTVAFGQVF